MIGSSKRLLGGLGLWAIIAIILVLLPVLFSARSNRGWQDILLTLLIWIGVAQSWNVIGGIGGQMSLGNSVFVGAGGYAAAMLMISGNMPWIVGLLGAAIVSAVLAWIVSWPLLRLSGVYFTIGSSAVALIALAWMVTWAWTGESRGLNIPTGALPDRTMKFQIIAICAVITCVAVFVILRSTWGLRLMAVRDDEGAAAALGVSPRSMKRQAWILSGALTGIMGACIAINQVSINPTNMFSLDWVVMALVMCIVGGLGTTWGPVIGAFVMYYLVNRALDDQPVLAALLSGVLIIIVISLAPQGIEGLIRQGWSWLRSRGRSSDDTTAGADEAATPAEVAG